jgi:hypothetical protein
LPRDIVPDPAFFTSTVPANTRVTRLGEFSPTWQFFTFGSSSENDKSIPNFGLCTFQHVNIDILILTKMYWATIWATFSQTHLVTLGLTLSPCSGDTGATVLKKDI